jgi:F0F1-type ATP synthase assembly protein I
MDDPGSQFFMVMGLGLELGFMIVIPLVGFMLLGLWADKSFHTLPLFTIIGLIVGLISSIVEVIKVILPFLEKRSQKK